MIFQYLEYPNFQAFVRLIKLILKKERFLDNQTIVKLIELGTFHGISKDDAYQIFDYCFDEYELGVLAA